MTANAAERIPAEEPGDASKYESVQMWRDNVVDVGSRSNLSISVTSSSTSWPTIYQRAGVPLTSIHLGGDEVPKGAWEKSPACERICHGRRDPRSRAAGNWSCTFLTGRARFSRGIPFSRLAGKIACCSNLDQDPAAGDARRAAGKAVPTAYVWNNVWGWGREDAAYRLANAGFDVVLCNATHLYFDLACEKDPLEPGYYWAGFVGMRAPFEFVPLDVFKNADRNAMGQPVTPEEPCRPHSLNAAKAREHVLGIQGQLWGENLRRRREPRIHGVSARHRSGRTRLGSSPEWAEIDDSRELARASLTATGINLPIALAQRELPRLDYLCGGVHYRLPPPGAVVRDGLVHANVAFPGLEIRYTVDGSEPTSHSRAYIRSQLRQCHGIKLKSFDSRGRGSRTVTVAASITRPITSAKTVSAILAD